MSRTAARSCRQRSVTVEGNRRGVGARRCPACERRTGGVVAAPAHSGVRRAAGEPRGGGACHDLSCQRRTGRVAVALAHFGLRRAAGEASRSVRAGDAGARFAFRPVAGGTVSRRQHGDRRVGVDVGAIADPSFRPPRASVCDRHCPPVRLPDGVRAGDAA